MLNTQEHIDLMAHFEKAHKGHRLDRETKDQWPAGHLYQHGEVNQLFLAYRKGYALAKCIYQEPGTAEAAPGTPIEKAAREYVEAHRAWQPLRLDLGKRLDTAFANLAAAVDGASLSSLPQEGAAGEGGA